MPLKSPIFSVSPSKIFQASSSVGIGGPAGTEVRGIRWRSTGRSEIETGAAAGLQAAPIAIRRTRKRTDNILGCPILITIQVLICGAVPRRLIGHILHKFIFSFIRAICVAVPDYYPEQVSDLWRTATGAGSVENADGEGAGSVFECGVTVRMTLSVRGGVVRKVRFRSNGCGWAVAASEAIARKLSGVLLGELGGLEDLSRCLSEELGGVPDARKECVSAAVTAVREALADHRNRVVGEWSGDKALICSCFGVAEDVIENAAESGTATTVEEIGELCRAGTGCGSCQMLIREILEGTGMMRDER